jgi:tetrapyrrole methylase family protein/MazG family protein
MPTNSPSIILLGLGPGDATLLTRQAWDLLNSIPEIYLRTSHHPAVAQLPSHLKVHTFDDLYNAAESFEAVYLTIVEQILDLGRRSQGVVYAVPGHPFIAESTCPEIARRAGQEGLLVQVIEGLSFFEPVFTALGLDPLPHTAVVDAFELADMHVPSFPPDAPALIAQIHSPAIASDVKLTLMEVYPDEHPVTLVHAAGSAGQVIEQLPLYAIDRSSHIGLLTTLFVPPLPVGTSFEAFQELIAHLRAPDGCPWDREQTHQTLRTHLLQETYEALEALDADNISEMREEFGDLLLQIVLHAQIANEYGEYRMADVIQNIYDKIIRRHPHVFGDLQVDGVGNVLQNWEKLKAAERESNGESVKGVLDGVSLALPALTQAQEYQARAARTGFEWPDLQGFLDKINEECREFVQAETAEERMLEIGDVMFTLVNLARRYQIDAESALRETNARFHRRFGYLEKSAHQQGRALTDLSLPEMLALWQESKS